MKLDVNEKLRVVIDTQIFLRAVINQRSLPAKIVYDYEDDYILIVSEATLAEIEDIISRPKVRKKFEFPENQISELLIRLARGERTIVHDIPAISRDSKDDMILACALSGNAHYIVSEDQDLLVLNTYKEIKIINALDFLRVLESRTQSQTED